ncbi:nonsense-mediated decay protein 4 [Monosporozyma unispora]|nr:nonsense-mediated decay protein 4 [Kazachstania unispora]
MVNNYHFVVDASAFEKGLGNIKRWDQWLNGKNLKKSSKKIHMELYVPVFTMRELEFLQFRRRSNNAKDALKFIEQQLNIQNHSNSPQSHRSLELIMEYEDILNTIPWAEVNINRVDRINRVPKRFKDLLKSCTYKCRLSSDISIYGESDDDDIIEVQDESDITNNNNDHYETENGSGNTGRWILVTEDPEIRQFADLCNIPHCSIVQIDSLLSKDLNDKTFKDTKKFNDMVMKNGIKEVSSNGDDIVKTKFKKTIYASRGSGKLWTP